MKRLLPYALIAVALAVPSALLAAVLHQSEEDQLESLVAAVEDEGLGPLVDNGAFDSQSGLEISAGSELHAFNESGQREARELLDELTGIDSARRVVLRQRQVTVRDGAATAVLNVELDGGTYVALRLHLVDDAGQWRVERVRVMS
jgi:hypothetical protein